MKSLEQLNLSHKYTQLPEHFYSTQAISQLLNPKMAGFNESVAKLLGLDPEQKKRDDFSEFFNGSKPLPGVNPISTVYSGHQFGYYVPQLGDGRAMLLGEVTNNDGETWEIQLKGAGPTPYSRSADGRAVLRSTVRELLCSEAMHGLGIPTTRALCLFDSDTPVYREEVERGALLVRVAQSHLRFGSFEYFYHRGLHDDLKLLADYVIKHYYPQLLDSNNPYLALLKTIIHKTAELIAQWQAVGFAHGVMNTDNMSILGLTLDYGPFGFLDSYNPGYVCNHSDVNGRYAFDQQPYIGEWNCSAIAQALIPFITVDEAKAALNEFRPQYKKYYRALMLRKLGLQTLLTENDKLIDNLLKLLEKNNVDYTLFFRRLCLFSTHKNTINESMRDLFIDREGFDQWSNIYRLQLQKNNSCDADRALSMQQENPKYILRNYLAQQAIEDAEKHNYETLESLLNVLQSPYDEHKEFEELAQLPPDWAQEIVISCSS